MSAGHWRIAAGGLLAMLGMAFAADFGAATGDRWWTPGGGRVFPTELRYANAGGELTTLNTQGPTSTTGHAFFEPLGTNGRACVTCHQPADGMSLSTATIRERWQSTAGRDPLFAMIDGANCPNLPRAAAASHSLLLERGLFRIGRSWPPRSTDGAKLTPQFTIEVVRDPTGCNLDPVYGLNSPNPTVSVYRRPRPATNVKYLTATGFFFEPKNGLPLPRDSESGELTSGNLLADARARTLKAQAIDALHSHLEFNGNPTPAQLRQIIEFMSGLYTAQSGDRWGGSLQAGGAQGGPETLAKVRAGDLQGTQNPIWSEFLPWKTPAASDSGDNAEQRAFRASVARGAELFTTRTFLVSDSAGINNMGFGSPVRNPCAFCHNMQHTGMDVAPGQVDLGTTNMPHANPSPELPLFKLSCKPGFAPHPHLGRVVYTQDPGYALTTGKCADIGKITIQSMRGLAARAPYFSNGSAATLREIVDFYDRRYQIALSEQEKQDLVNLMGVL
jgi:cytochrome c peroxidase